MGLTTIDFLWKRDGETNRQIVRCFIWPPESIPGGGGCTFRLLQPLPSGPPHPPRFCSQPNDPSPCLTFSPLPLQHQRRQPSITAAASA